MKSLNHDHVNYKSVLVAIILTFAARPAPGCGGSFPNNLLEQGDNAVLSAPSADFDRQLKIIRLAQPKFQAHNTKDFAGEAAEADAADLKAALKDRKVSVQDQNSILKSYAGERGKLTDFRQRLAKWNPEGDSEWVNGEFVHHDPEPRPSMTGFDASALADVPAEFVDYLEGSAAWYATRTNEARIAWQSIIHRPAAERRHRSTWATYMLGRSYLQEDPETAIGYFEQVRILTSRGFPDSLGLAAASLGEEARVFMNEKKFDAAIRLYIEQYATGENGAAVSLRFACRDALSAENFDLTMLATNRDTRRVMSAFLTDGENTAFIDSMRSNRVRWLQAVESANVHDMASAEQLALMAYQAGEWDIAQRWVERASQTPTAQWLQVKLFLHGGKIGNAAEVLERVAELFPAQPTADEDLKTAGLENIVYDGPDYFWNGNDPVRHQIQAEAGVLHLARREYVESLDALLRAGHWDESAYVAERVLTAGELKNYVDKNWSADDAITNSPGKDIRYLLGRRLARDAKLDEARPYYPAEEVTNYDEMVRNLDTARNEALAVSQRKQAYVKAADILGSDGRDLVGTEVYPDWRCDRFDAVDSRRGQDVQLVRASEDEIKRTEDGVDSNLWRHYRYQAAGLAWDGAKLMADNTDEKARLLCDGGSWIKYLDADKADYFYKELVRRCHKTTIGALADRMRWFPSLDDNGNPLPWQPAEPVETNGPAKEIPGTWYALRRGNDLQDVANIVQKEHNLAITIAMLEQANPEINLNRLKAGLKVFVPGPAPARESPPIEIPAVQ